MTEMVETRRIPLTPFTGETFERYGVCLEVPSEDPHRRAGTHAQLWQLGDLEFTLKSPFAGIVRYLQRGFVCSTMERHPGETQTFVPIDRLPSIVAVAERNDQELPDPDTFRGFLLDGTKGLALHRGTWVRHFYPIGDKADYVVITGRRENHDDVDNIDLAAQLGVQFEFILEGRDR
jgi:ureidoglycolate hydrolase